MILTLKKIPDSLVICETLVDFTDNGANVEIDDQYSDWNYKNKPDGDGKSHYYEDIENINGVVTMTAKHCIYTEEIFNACKDQTEKYVGKYVNTSGINPYTYDSLYTRDTLYSI